MHPSILILFTVSLVGADAHAVARATDPVPKVGAQPAAAVGQQPDAQRRKRCAERRTEYRERATEFFKLPAGTDFNAQQVRNKLMLDYCKVNRETRINNQGRGDGFVGVCERTLFHIINVMVKADGKMGEACLHAEKAGELRGCENVSCLGTLSSSLKQASAKMTEASNLVKEGLKELDALAQHNARLGEAYGSHLIEIAKTIREFNESQQAMANSAQPPMVRPTTFHDLSAANQRIVLNQAIQERLGTSMLQVEGSGDAVKVLAMYGFTPDKADPAAIEQRGRDIRTAAKSDVDLPGDGNFIQSYGHYAGEQIRMARTAEDFEVIAKDTGKELEASATRMNGYATTIDQRIAGAASVDPPAKPAPAVNVAGGRPVGNPTLAPARTAAGDINGTTASRAMDLASLAGSLSAMSQPSEAPSPKQQRAQQAAIAYQAAPAAAAPARGEPTRALKLSSEDAPAVATKNSEKKRKDDDAMPETALGTLESGADLSLRTAGQYPERPSSGEDVSYTPYGGARPEAVRSPATEGVSAGTQLSQKSEPWQSAASAKEDPAMTAYVEGRLGRLESGGRRFTPSLRNKIREKLKEGFSLRQLAAKNAAKRSGSSGAVAGLIQDMRDNGTLPGSPGFERGEKFTLAGAETDEQIRRLMGELPEDEDVNLGILSSQSRSLFERVHAVHQRRFGAAKVAGQ